MPANSRLEAAAEIFGTAEDDSMVPVLNEESLWEQPEREFSLKIEVDNLGIGSIKREFNESCDVECRTHRWR